MALEGKHMTVRSSESGRFVQRRWRSHVHRGSGTRAAERRSRRRRHTPRHAALAKRSAPAEVAEGQRCFASRRRRRTTWTTAPHERVCEDRGIRRRPQRSGSSGRADVLPAGSSRGDLKSPAPKVACSDECGVGAGHGDATITPAASPREIEVTLICHRRPPILSSIRGRSRLVTVQKVYRSS